jgi:hypothetical protein
MPAGLCNAAVSLSLANRAADKKYSKRKKSGVRFNYFGGLSAAK